MTNASTSIENISQGNKNKINLLKNKQKQDK
jgi:hypothetical protein